ncbi:MAG: polynucleotide adenylyltransferase PcnB, partial [Gammaproteobacteria bacterium]
MREIWELQPRFERRTGKRAFRLLTHPRFRAAYDFLCLRVDSGEPLGDLCEWWTRFQEADSQEQRKMAQVKNNRRKRRKPRRSSAGQSGGQSGGPSGQQESGPSDG